MTLKDFKISAVDTSKGLTLGEVKTETAEKISAKAQGACGMGYECAGGGGRCGMSYNCAGQ